MFSFNSSNSELRIPSKQMPNNPLSANLKNWSNSLKQFVSFPRRIVWVCLTILWGWRLNEGLV